ncbi:MAG: hypothetical protein KIS78_04480 [Labilithrix sp.]|nr:hypothetical protein [Labilithrix sp.]
MSTILHSISRIDGDRDVYEVILDVDGRRQSMLCRVVEHTGIRVVQPTPDLISTLPFAPRLLVAAVLAFDDARKEGDAQAST